MQNNLLIILITLTLMSCNGEKRELSLAQKEVKKILIDPESAQFRNVSKVIFGICGEVNAKNSFGGYTGFKKFHYAPKSKDVDDKFSVIIETEDNLSTINILCESSN